MSLPMFYKYEMNFLFIYFFFSCSSHLILETFYSHQHRLHYINMAAGEI